MTVRTLREREPMFERKWVGRVVVADGLAFLLGDGARPAYVQKDETQRWKTCRTFKTWKTFKTRRRPPSP